MAGKIAQKVHGVGRGGTRITVDAQFAKTVVAQVIAIAKEEAVKRRADLEGLDSLGWEGWLRRFFPAHITSRAGEVNFAPYHTELWDWAWTVDRGVRPPPFVAIWPRGGAKSTSVELAVASWACRERRKYVLYVSESQAQADDHVGNIANLLESESLGLAYPVIADRATGKYGNPKAWRRNRIRTPNFTVDALGLDVAARGAKLDEDRPDAIVFDDVDSQDDSLAAVEKKVRTITTKLVPAGAEDVLFMFVQNLIHPESIASQLVDGRAQFFRNRVVSGPFPALQGMAVNLQPGGSYQIVAGTPTWAGMSLDRCQEMMDDMGLAAFMSECQHDVTAPPGGMFSHLTYQHVLPADLPQMVRIVVWVDPAVTDTDHSDSHGISAMGLGEDGKVYALYSWEKRASPTFALRTGILKAIELKADHLGVETDQGGDLWRNQFESVWAEMVREGFIDPGLKRLPFREEKAGAGHGPKTHRASRMLVDYEHGQIVHLVNEESTHEALERALNRFPTTKPYDLVDSEYWAWQELTNNGDQKWTGWAKYARDQLTKQKAVILERAEQVLEETVARQGK